MPRKSDPYFSRLYISAFIIVLAVALAVLMALQFAQGQYAKELRGWQVKLGLIADSRLNAVDNWLAQQYADMRELAENPAVRGFVAGERTGGDRLAQEAYLRRLLANAAGGQGGMPVEAVYEGGSGAKAGGGVALLDNNGAVLLASADMPPLTGHLERFLKRAVPGETQLMDVTSVENGAALQMGFLAPVFAAKEIGAPDRQTGWVFGVRDAGRELFGLLQHPGVIEASLENLLVREENGGVTYITPLMDGTKPLRKHLSLKDEPASAFAIRDAGSFATRADYRGKSVLVMGRTVPDTPWTLVTKVDEDEALAAAVAERRGLVLQLLLAVAVVFALVVAAWRHGTSRQATRTARRLETALRKAESREKMLDVITDSQPGAIFLVDAAEECCYANEAFAEQVGLPRDGVAGKLLEHLVGGALAAEYARASEAALRDGRTITWTRRERAKGGEVERVLRVRHIPLEQLPVEHAPLGARGVLVVEQDITALVIERERRVRTLRRLVETLVAMVDRRDPYAANHSKMVAIVARKVADEMDAEPVMAETAEIAGTVMNIGKMVVPAEWLTKPGALDDKERAAIRDSLLDSAALLEEVEFDGPVAETLRQTLETWDGKGPRKLKGDAILLPARIVSAANAFVGMISPRAYRKALGVDQALEVLMKGAGKEFDRKVVVALANYIDNHGGRAMMTSLAQAPDDE